MENFRRHCWLAGFLVTFGILLALRGMGLREFMSPEDVRIILAVLLSIGIVSVAAFFYFISHYSTHAPEPENAENASQLSREHLRQGGSGETVADDQATPLLASSSIQNPSYGSVSPGPTAKSVVCVHLGNNRVDSRSLSYFLAKHSHTMAIYIFGGGSIVLSLFQLFYVSQCLHFFARSGLGETEDPYTFTDQLPRIIAAALKIIFFAMEVPLLHFLSSVKSLKCKTISRHILLPIMGANFAAWLYTFLDETKIIHLYNYNYPTEANDRDIGKACRNHSSVVEIYMRGSMLHIFYPITMEFCIVSFEILHHVYIAPVCEETRRPDPHAYSTQEQDDIISKVQSFSESGTKLKVVAFHENVLQDNNETQANRKGLEVTMMVPRRNEEKLAPSMFQKILGYCLLVFHPCTALVCGLTEASLMKISFLHDDVTQYHYISDYYLYAVCKIPLLAFRIFFHAIPELLVTVFCLYVVNGFRRQRKSRGVHWSLILGVLGITIISIYTLALCTQKFKQLPDKDDDLTERRWMYGLFVLEWLLYGPQYFLQVFLIYHGQRKIAEPGHALYKPLYQCLSYLAMSNFVHWGINSFLEGEYLKRRNDLAQGAEAWDLLVHLVLPTCIYFRYISTFVLLEIKHLITMEEVHVQEWKLVVNK